MALTKLMIVGGFLGAGKTTLLWKTAQLLIKKGLSVGLITNDQAPELVDSKLLSLNDLLVSEVSGSCFCCNFNRFTEAIQKMRKGGMTDVIIAEPVGSCADLSATLMQPLKKYWNRDVQLMPLTVLADPDRLNRILEGENAGMQADTAYIYRKQLEESDIILINKTDMLSPNQLEDLKLLTNRSFPSSLILSASAKDETGLHEWLDNAYSLKKVGSTLLEMDYDIYANGEALLGWLNGTLIITGDETDWDALTQAFLKRLANQFDRQKMNVGHIKVITENQHQFMVGNITGNASTIVFRKSAGCSKQAKMIINARVETSPETLDRIIKQELNALCLPPYQTEVLAWQYFQPGRPEPTHRFSTIL